MARQAMNANKMSQVDMMNNQAMMGMASFMQKLGKGKRKYVIKIDKGNKKFLGKLAEEMKKQMGVYGNNPQAKGMGIFLNYLESECKKKDKELRLSYDELEFLKKTISESVKQMTTIKFKWYQFIKKIAVKMMAKQYKILLEEIKK